MEWKRVTTFDGRFASPPLAVLDALRGELGKLQGELIRITIDKAVDEKPEAQWKKVYENPDASVKSDGIIPRGQWAYIPVAGLAGKRIRITVEAEVNECCEKWRKYLHPGGGIPTFRVNEPGCYSDLVGPVVYCPTCKEKL